ncbi:MAG: hypothetical protein WC028_02855 [Candidatus Obscuribacterales bacterium]
MPTQPSFHDKSLSTIVKESAIELDQFQKKLDEASSDTLELEKWLQSTGFCIDVYVDVNIPGYDSIGWDKCGNAWRLVARYWTEGFNSDLNSRSLVDSSARLRLACKPFLPLLVKKLTDTLVEIQNGSEPSDDDFVGPDFA